MRIHRTYCKPQGNHHSWWEIRDDLLNCDAESVDNIKNYLRRVRRAHTPLSDEPYPTLSTILGCLYQRHHTMADMLPFEKRYYQQLPDEAYEILALLEPYYTYNDCTIKTVVDAHIFEPAVRGDLRMLKYLWTLPILTHRDWNQHLNDVYRAALSEFCFMRLPEWGELEHLHEGDQKTVFSTVVKQAERCGVPYPEHLEFLIQHGCCDWNALSPTHPHAAPGFSLNLRHNNDGSTGWEILSNISRHLQQDPKELALCALENGEHWPFTCSCGFPEDAGIYEPVVAIRHGEYSCWRVVEYPNCDSDKLQINYFRFPVRKYLEELDLLLTTIDRGIRQELARTPIRLEDDSFLENHTVLSSGLPYRKKLAEIRKIVRQGLHELSAQYGANNSPV